jgi:hypothetical protein
MILLGGDFDDAIDVIDVWMYVNAPSTLVEAADEDTVKVISH